MCIIVALCMQTTKKKLISYVLILPQAFFAVLDVRSPIEELLRGLRCVFLVCNLSTKKVAGLRWVRKGIGGIDLSGESLVQRSHNTGPVQIKKKQQKQLTACQSHKQVSSDCVAWTVCLVYLRFEENRWQAASFHLRDGAKKKKKGRGEDTWLVNKHLWIVWMTHGVGVLDQYKAGSFAAVSF